MAALPVVLLTPDNSGMFQQFFDDAIEKARPGKPTPNKFLFLPLRGLPLFQLVATDSDRTKWPAVMSAPGVACKKTDPKYKEELATATKQDKLSIGIRIFGEVAGPIADVCGFASIALSSGVDGLLEKAGVALNDKQRQAIGEWPLFKPSDDGDGGIVYGRISLNKTVFATPEGKRIPWTEIEVGDAINPLVRIVNAKIGTGGVKGFGYTVTIPQAIVVKGAADGFGADGKFVPMLDAKEEPVPMEITEEAVVAPPAEEHPRSPKKHRRSVSIEREEQELNEALLNYPQGGFGNHSGATPPPAQRRKTSPGRKGPSSNTTVVPQSPDIDDPPINRRAHEAAARKYLAAKAAVAASSSSPEYRGGKGRGVPIKRHNASVTPIEID